MSVPHALLTSLTGTIGFDKEAFENIHASGAQVTSIRINPYKQKTVGDERVRIQAADVLSHFTNTSHIPWCENGYYLSERPSFTTDPLFHAGCYYVQEPSSMFLEQVVKTCFRDHSVTPYRVLDLCAAPGGKSTHLSGLFPKGLVVANEVIKTRSGILAENAIKWGNDNMVVTSNDAHDFQKLRGYFDLIVVDAPCSGSGMFRKDPEAINEWSLENVDYCSKRQKRILEDVWPALKENGILVYCTCSYSQEENEDILDWLSKNVELESVRIDIEQYAGIIESESEEKKCWGYRFYPDKIKGEGFFISCVRKCSIEGETHVTPKEFLNASPNEKNTIAPFVQDPPAWDYIHTEEEITLINKIWLPDVATIFSALYVKKMGLRAGRVIKDQLIPSHELAMSNQLTGTTTKINIEKTMALEYLRKKDISIATSTKGWLLVSFNGFALGWIKALPNRVNNYYPASFRILKD
ncbi:MAG: RNA methyltransferase [Agriterribacter sp.]